MSQRKNPHQELKSLLDQWHVELNELQQLCEESGNPLMDFKRTLENTWTIFESKFK
jgi:hypothetical protein